MSQELAIASPQSRNVGPFSDIQSFENAQRMAKALCSSPLVPNEYRGDSGLGSALIALELAQRMNASPLMVMQNLDVIHGRPSWRSQMVIAAINSSGHFSPLRYEMNGEGDDQNCRAYAYDQKTGDRLEGPLVSIAIAKAEGWYGRNGSKWKTIPELMLRYRAAAWWGRQYAPELLMGLPTVDETADTEIYAGEAQRAEEKASPAAISIMDKARQTKAIEQQTEWPKQIDGVWEDSRGIAFNPEIHGVSADGTPAATRAGEFCKRRGCDPSLHKKLEREALAALMVSGQSATEQLDEPQGDLAPEPEQQQEDEQNEPQTAAQDGIGYPEIRSAIERATDLEALADAEDMLRDGFSGPSGQRSELDQLIAARRHKLAQIGG